MSSKGTYLMDLINTISKSIGVCVYLNLKNNQMTIDNISKANILQEPFIVGSELDPLSQCNRCL